MGTKLDTGQRKVQDEDSSWVAIQALVIED